GLHPGADFDGHAIAALAGTTLRRATGLLTRLTRAHLVQPRGPGRYGMHDLLRSYARELAKAGGEDSTGPALTGLFDFYLHTAAAAMDAVFPAQRHRRPRIPAPDAVAVVVTGPAAARS